MNIRRNWFTLILFLSIAALFLAACERPLPGGYNDPDAGLDLTGPATLESIPQVDPGTAQEDVQAPEPVDVAPAAPEEAVEPEAYPADAGGEQAVEDSAVDPNAPAAEPQAGEEAAPEGEQTAPAEEEAAPEASEPGETAETPGTHTVAAGENLFRIGLLYGVSWLDLAAANGITDPASLAVGQVLVIPSAEEAAEDAAGTEAPEAAAEQPAEETEAPPADEELLPAEAEERPATYVVQQGDNLYQIGLRFGIAWTELAAYNGIVGTQIAPGQVLNLPPLAEEENVDDTADVEDETPVEGTSYVVQEKDTVFSVAFKHSIAWTALVEANGLESPFTLEVGQTLIIPTAD